MERALSRRGGRFGRTDIKLVSPDKPLGLGRGDSAGRDDITLISRMNLPVGKPVIVYLSSKGVVHSSGLPLMRVKQDATPAGAAGLVHSHADGPVGHRLLKLCLGHFRMRGFYSILSQSDYDAWLAKEAAPPQRLKRREGRPRRARSHEDIQFLKFLVHLVPSWRSLCDPQIVGLNAIVTFAGASAATVTGKVWAPSCSCHASSV
jgi:hypothetical protein